MREEKVLTDAVLCFLMEESRVLLARKADSIGMDCWNGYGGGIDEEESPEDCAIRELREEALIDADRSSLEKVAIVDFCNTKSDGGVFVCRVHTFIVRQWNGEPCETKEMLTPTWFEADSLPFDRMMPADRLWLPHIFIAKRKVLVRAHLGPYQKSLLGKVSVEHVNGFPDC